MLFKKNRVLFLLLFVSVFSHCQKKKTDVLSSLSDKELIQKALNEVEVNESNTDFVTAKVSPNNKNETIIVIPEVVNKEEDMYELNSYILIINNKTGVILHKFFESSKESGWVSDAIYIADVSIDTTNYKLSAIKKAFGIIVHYIGSSQPNPYSRKDFSLYTKESASLKKVLDSYPIHEESGEVDVSADACYSDIKKYIKKISMTNSVTNEYFDLSIVSTNSKLASYKDKDGDCDVKQEMVSIKKELLKFNGTSYQK
jgi:hypothetical protein